MENKPVSAVESNLILNDLYLKFLKKIDIGIKWNLEAMEEKTPSICIKTISSAMKTKEMIGGGYEAELPFYVYVKHSTKDTASILSAIKVLNDLASVFEKEQISGFKNLNLTDAQPKKLEMTSTPADADVIENNIGIFGATYRLVYKKKGRYE